MQEREKAAIKRLRHLASVWPDTLWIFAADGCLNVMKLDMNGKRAYTAYGGVDPAYLVASITVPSDGGDW